MPVKVEVLTDLAALRPRLDRVGARVTNAAPSPSGARVLFEARGDVFSVPAEFGPVRNLTESSGTAERTPAWSPDGKSVAYWSDASGEYELYVRPAAGGAARQVTRYGPGFRYQPFWSPDSKSVAFIDASMTIRVVDVATGTTRTVDKQLYHFDGNLRGFRPSWSRDSRWLAYAKDLPGRKSAIAVWDATTGTHSMLTAGFYADGNPVFDPEGKYLFYRSGRNMSPSYSDLDNSWAYVNATVVMAAPLRKDVPSPLAPRTDEEKGAPAAAAAPAAPAAATPPAAAPPAAPRRRWASMCLASRPAP